MSPHSSQDELEKAFGEPLDGLLDITSWQQGHDLNGLYERLEAEVAASVEQKERTHPPMRRLIQERLSEMAGQGTSPDNAGLFKITPADLAYVHNSLLFNGATECCDGTVVAHDGLLLTVAQIGVSLVRYQGASGTWLQRMYRRDIRQTFDDPLEEAIALLEARGMRRESADAPESHDETSQLMRRGLMEYAERAALLHHSDAVWRMGHGNPIPLSLLFSRSRTLFGASTEILRTLLLDHKKWLYIPSAPTDRIARTIGDALFPLEYALLGTIEDTLNLEKLTRGSGPVADRTQLQKFLSEVLPHIVYGVYRAASYAPAQMFYAHRDYAHVAASLALADSVMQPLRGFPMLIDIADLTCRSAFDASCFASSVSGAYARAGYPVQYLGERETRHG
ncbi:MAG: hypothetical protein QM758_06380 [Armatimonas sp.]